MHLSLIILTCNTLTEIIIIFCRMTIKRIKYRYYIEYFKNIYIKVNITLSYTISSYLYFIINYVLFKFKI